MKQVNEWQKCSKEGIIFIGYKEHLRMNGSERNRSTRKRKRDFGLLFFSFVKVRGKYKSIKPNDLQKEGARNFCSKRSWNGVLKWEKRGSAWAGWRLRTLVSLLIQNYLRPSRWSHRAPQVAHWRNSGLDALWNSTLSLEMWLFFWARSILPIFSETSWNTCLALNKRRAKKGSM